LLKGALVIACFIVYTITYTALLPQAKIFSNAGQSDIVLLHLPTEAT